MSEATVTTKLVRCGIRSICLYSPQPKNTEHNCEYCMVPAGEMARATFASLKKQQQIALIHAQRLEWYFELLTDTSFVWVTLPPTCPSFSWIERRTFPGSGFVSYEELKILQEVNLKRFLLRINSPFLFLHESRWFFVLCQYTLSICISF